MPLELNRLCTSGDLDVKFDFYPPTMDDLSDIVKNIKTDISSCVKGINMNVCKRLLQIIPDKCLMVYANSMYTSIFPSEWTISTVNLLP